MHKASKEFGKILPQVDLVIEVLDARLPGSSENPMLKKLRRGKPCIKLLNKSDLADAEAVEVWRRHLKRESMVETLAISMKDDAIGGLPALCRELVPLRENRSRMVVAMIAGIPNVGKSTLINRLADRRIARTGNEAAMTRMQQRIEISPELTLVDTPGLLWPKIINPNSGLRLAATGAIRDTALDLQEVAMFVAAFMRQCYPERLIRRYDIDPLPRDEVEVLEVIARRRGCIVSGNEVDYEKAARLLIGELRDGSLGPVCLETPEGFERELEAAERGEAERAAARAARKAERKKRK